MRNCLGLLGLLGIFAVSGCGEKPLPFVEENALEKQVSGDRALSHVKSLVELGPRPAGSDSLEQSRLFIETQLAEFGWETRRQAFEDKTPEGTVEFANLRARFGDDRWDQPLSGLICSHYDTKYYESFEFVGANDGGSSTGLLLELARVLAGRPELAERIELVFFDGEEAFGPNITQRDGLYGSRHFATEMTLVDPALRPAWGVLLDMVGDKDLRIRAGIQVPGKSLERLAKSEGSDYRVDIRAVKESIRLMSEDLLAAASDLDFRSEVGISPDYIIDDHIPLNVVAGIPTINLIDFDYDYWHTPADTIDKVSPESLEITGKVTLRLIEKYLARRK